MVIFLHSLKIQERIRRIDDTLGVCHLCARTLLTQFVLLIVIFLPSLTEFLNRSITTLATDGFHEAYIWEA